MSKSTIIFLVSLFGLIINKPTTASTDGYNSAIIIFKNKTVTNKNGFRIPAITTTSQGTVIAASDIRYAGTSGNTDIPNQVEFIVRVSNDGGRTWDEGQILNSPTVIGGKNYITDANLVSNKDTGATFIFGYQNNKSIVVPDGTFDWIVYNSNNGGKSWNSGESIKNLLPKGFEYALQGPGNGMYYNGIVYVPYQAWNNKGGAAPKATSGFIYSKDNGKTWESSELLSNVTSLLTSESSVFHHKGKIYLATKNEDKNTTTTVGEKARIVFATSDNGKTWEKIEESFLPKNIAKGETSTLSLNEDIYLVGYALQGVKPWDRNDIYVTTNTEKKIKLWEGDSYGYTSMAVDDDNLYVLYEGGSTTGDVLLRKFDISSKDYTNLNAIILERSNDLSYIQNKVAKNNESYIIGSYGKDDLSAYELLINGQIKFGVFQQNQPDRKNNIYGAINYKTKDTTFVFSSNDVFSFGDNIIAGYQKSDVDYVNKSKNEIDSYFWGYSTRKNVDIITYDLSLNGIYSKNKFKRNNYEGLGREASFNSYSFSVQNSIYKNYTTQDIYIDLMVGLNSSVFNHSGFVETGGNGWNNITMERSNNISNKMLANIQMGRTFDFIKDTQLTLTSDVAYHYELMNTDRWSEKYTVLDVNRTMSSPMKKHNSGLLTGLLKVTIDVNKQTSFVVTGSKDTDGYNMIKGSISYNF